MSDPNQRIQLEEERNRIDNDYENYVNQYGTSEEADAWREEAHRSISDELNK